jgi:hypothetical protein
MVRVLCSRPPFVEFLSSPACSHEDAIAIGNGCGPVLEAIVSCIADEGDVILVPSPYYHAFSIGVFGIRLHAGYTRSSACPTRLVARPVQAAALQDHCAPSRGTDSLLPTSCHTNLSGLIESRRWHLHLRSRRPGAALPDSNQQCTSRTRARLHQPAQPIR